MKKGVNNCRSPGGKVSKGILFCITLLLAAGFLCAKNASATEAPSTISISAKNTANLTLDPGSFNSVDHPISVETSSSYGYTLTMETAGDSTDLTPASGNTTIPTITLPQGTTSITAASFNNNYGYSLDGTNYKPAPAIGTEDVVATTTKANADDTPDTYTVTFGAKVDIDVPANQYSRTFVFTATTNDSLTCTVEHICYIGNGDDLTGAMDEQSTSSNTSVTLVAPNYSRPGYGFAGWNTKADGSGINYGPNETFTTGDLSLGGLILYAKWIPSSGSLQNWKGCKTLSISDVIALTDTRDNNTYAIAKLADGECWMVENLRLDLSKQNVAISNSNTNNPTADFIAAVNNHPSSTNSFCSTDRSACINQISFNTNNINRNLTASYSNNDNSSSWYAYGNYYNWYTATAGNGTFETSTAGDQVSGDICPAGWALPTGYGSSGNLTKLDIALGNSGNNASSSSASKKWRAYPNNFLYSGQYINDTGMNRGETGNYFSSNAINSQTAANLWLQPSRASTNSNGTPKHRGETVRCIVNHYYTVHFDENINQATEGTMDDQKITTDVSTKLLKNSFSATYDSVTSTAYLFTGWNTKADGTGNSYADEASVLNLTDTSKTITLYAQWEKIRYFNVTVNFDTNGVTSVDIVNDFYGSHTITTSGATILLAENKPYEISLDVNTSHQFDDWSTTENGVLVIATASQTTYTISGNATLTANTSAREGKLYLQDVTSSICSTTPKVAYDSRDGEAYVIQKLSDNKCWMLDNLRLDTTNLTTILSTSNTNMSPDIAFSLPQSGFASTYDDPKLDNSNKDYVSTSFGTNGSGKAGVYYNYCAASAGTLCSKSSTVDATYDICPKGWSLPNGNTTTGDFVSLYAAYSNNGNNLRNGLNITLSGFYNASSNAVENLNSNTYIWSNAAYNNNKSYAFYAGKGSLNTTFNALRNNGLSIRCVLKTT